MLAGSAWWGTWLPGWDGPLPVPGTGPLILFWTDVANGGSLWSPAVFLLTILCSWKQSNLCWQQRGPNQFWSSVFHQCNSKAWGPQWNTTFSFRVHPTAVMRVWASAVLLFIINQLLTGSWLWAVAAAGLPFCRVSSGPLQKKVEKIHCRGCLIFFFFLKWLSERTCPFFWIKCHNLLLRDSADSFFLSRVAHPVGLVGALFCQSFRMLS